MDLISYSDSLRPHGLYTPWNSPGQNTGVGNRSLLQGILPTQGSNPSLLHCRWILYQLSHQESPFYYHTQIKLTLLYFTNSLWILQGFDQALICCWLPEHKEVLF